MHSCGWMVWGSDGWKWGTVGLACDHLRKWAPPLMWASLIHSPSTNQALGGFLLRKVWNFKLCMLPSWSTLLTDFRTIFVFALGPFLPMKVIFFDYNGNFNGKMAKTNKMAKNHFSRSDFDFWGGFSGLKTPVLTTLGGTKMALRAPKTPQKPPQEPKSDLEKWFLAILAILNILAPFLAVFTV